jgi:hypothetical protein
MPRLSGIQAKLNCKEPQPERPVVSEVEVKSAPDTRVSSLPAVEIKGLLSQLDAIARKKYPEHKPDKEVSAALVKIAAEIKRLESVDIAPIVKALSEITLEMPAVEQANYKFTVNRDRNGFITTIDAIALNED